MAISIKTSKEIQIMQEGGKILSDVLHEVMRNVKPGISEIELDKLAENLILKRGAKPGFKMVKGYNNATCICVNDEVVHGIPGEYRFKEGDVVNVDLGVYYKGFNTDSSQTVRVQSSRLASEAKRAKFKVQNSNEIDKFLETGKKALEEAIKVARVGNRIGHISKTIQGVVEQEGYSIVKSLVGHGIGKKLHEEPEIPGFLNQDINNTHFLMEGMTIAIEVIYNMGKSGVVVDEDGWTIRTKDKSLSAIFEKTVAITKNAPLVLTG